MIKKSIKTKILLLTIFVAFIPGVVGVLSTYIKGSQVFEESIGNKFLEIARQISLLTDTLIEKEASELRIMAQNSEIDRILKDKEISESEKKLFDTFFSCEESKEGHSAFSVHTMEGEELLFSGSESTHPFIEPTALLKIRESDDKIVAGEIYIANERLLLPLYAPLKRDSSVKGVLTLLIDLYNFFDEKMGEIFLGSTGHINIVSADGTILYDPMSPEGGRPFSETVMKKVREKGEGWFIDIDEHGLNSVIAFSPLDFSDSKSMGTVDEKKNYIILTQDSEELFEDPIRSVLLSTTVPGFIFASALMFLVYVFLRETVSPIKKLQDGVAIIGKGQLDYKIDIKTGDEIEALAGDFNHMAAELKGMYEGLEQKVKDRTLELEQSNRELEKANRLKSEFLANMSHELRTPLNSILGFSDVLIDQVCGTINEKQERYIGNIRKSGHHLLDVINDILDISKIEAGKMSLLIESFPFSRLVAEVHSTIKPLSDKKNLGFSFEISPDVGDVNADRLRIKQVLLNLLGNAVKFTQEGGSIRLFADIKEDRLRVCVSDTGIGIEEKDMDIIFEAFRQADGSASRDFEGTGLGLALSRKFIEMHGGSIFAVSKPGEGSEFTFFIPLSGNKIKSEHLINEI